MQEALWRLMLLFDVGDLDIIIGKDNEMPKHDKPGYVLPIDAVRTLRGIQESYKKETGVDLNKSAQPNRLWRAVGYKDVDARRDQTALIRKLAKYAEHFKGDRLVTLAYPSKQWAKAQHSLRVLLGLCYVTKKQIELTYSTGLFGARSYGTLHGIIDKLLNVQSDNKLDSTTKATCMLALKNTTVEEINEVIQSLDSEEEEAITPMEWNRIQYEAERQFQRHRPNASTPFADTGRYVGRQVGRVVGVGVGFVFGRLVGQSGATSGAKALLTAAVGSSFVFFGPWIGTGVMAATLMARQFAEESVDISCGYMGALLVSSATSKLGAKAGWGTGYVLDSAVAGAASLCQMLQQNLNLGGDDAIKRIGINLATGEFAVQTASGKHLQLELETESGDRVSLHAFIHDVLRKLSSKPHKAKGDKLIGINSLEDIDAIAELNTEDKAQLKEAFRQMQQAQPQSMTHSKTPLPAVPEATIEDEEELASARP